MKFSGISVIVKGSFISLYVAMQEPLMHISKGSVKYALEKSALSGVAPDKSPLLFVFISSGLIFIVS